MPRLRKQTICIHNQPDSQTGAVVKPIHMSTPYRFPNDRQEVIYPGSINTPAAEEVERKIAVLEHAESAMITASGQSAIAAALLTFLSPGDHVLFHGEQYGGTTFFTLNVLEKYGITYDFVFGDHVADFSKSIRSETKVIYFESPTNPLLTVLDMQAISELAVKHNLVTIIDSTFATPINQNPIQHGIDIVIHSGTKYLNGHSDVSCGVIATSKAHMDKIRPMVELNL